MLEEFLFILPFKLTVISLFRA